MSDLLLRDKIEVTHLKSLWSSDKRQLKWLSGNQRTIRTKPSQIYSFYLSVQSRLRTVSPGEQGKRSEEKESQVRDSRLNEEMEGNGEPCCYEEKEHWSFWKSYRKDFSPAWVELRKNQNRTMLDSTHSIRHFCWVQLCIQVLEEFVVMLTMFIYYV